MYRVRRAAEWAGRVQIKQKKQTIGSTIFLNMSLSLSLLAYMQTGSLIYRSCYNIECK
jgi:hypothetical protein